MKKNFLNVFISRQVIVFYLLYIFYIIIIILLFHDLIKVRVISRIRVFGTSIASLIIIVVYNRNNRKNNSLVLFYNLLGI
jgi:positive regulator of sigma E activity